MALYMLNVPRKSVNTLGRQRDKFAGRTTVSTRVCDHDKESCAEPPGGGPFPMPGIPRFTRVSRFQFPF